MKKTIYIINYWTSQYYEKNIWDKYYCQSSNSAKNKIKELMTKDSYNITTIKRTIKPLEEYILNTKTLFFSWQVPNLANENDDLFIWIEKEILY